MSNNVQTSGVAQSELLHRDPDDGLISPSSSTATLCSISNPEKGDEPQNPLTRQFTVDEWEALRNLRTRLHDIYVTAYGIPEKEPEQLEQFSIWGIQVDVADPKSDARVSVILMQFLRAKNLDVDAAQRKLTKTLKWRKNVTIDKLIEHPSKPFTRYFGHSKTGLPVLYVKASSVDWDTWRITNGKIVASIYGLGMSRATEINQRQLDFENASHTMKVIDFSGLKLGSIPRDIGQKIGFLRYVYPKLVDECVFINFPHLTLLLWSMRLRKLFRKRPKDRKRPKITCVGTDKKAVTRALLTFIDAENIPQQFGGEAEGFSWPSDIEYKTDKE